MKMIRSDTDPRVPVCGFTIRSESIIRQSTVLGSRAIPSEAGKVAAAGFQRWDSHTHTHRRDVNGAIYRRYVAGMEFRCVLQKSETRVCVHDVLKRGKKRKQEERDKQRATD